MGNRLRAHVLVVEDDPASSAILAFIAEDQGKVRVSQAGSAREMGAVLRHDVADLIILDLQLPDGNGLCLARRVRDRSNVPIVVVTGDASRETRRSALEIGVNDFVTKPFDVKEMRQRVRDLLGGSAGPARAEATEAEVVAFDRYRLNHGERALYRARQDGVGGDAIRITCLESLVLAGLIERRNATVSRAALLDALGVERAGRPHRVIDACVATLRRKIETDPRKPAVIRTVRGIGYTLVG